MQLIELSCSDRLVVEAGAVFTGSSFIAGDHIRVHLSDGKIEHIEEDNDQVTEPISHKNCRVIGGDHLTIIPCFIDCHVHLALDGVNSSLEKQRMNPQLLKDGLQDRLFSYLIHGIAAVRDGGDRDGIGVACRDMVERMELKGPLVMASGKALRKNGGYGSFLGPGAAPGEFAQIIKRYAVEGINQVKILVSGIVSFKEYGRVSSVQFDLKELSQIVQVAGEYGLKVMAHASSDEAVRLCIKAGVHSVEHGFFVSEDSLMAMAEKGVAWVPTVVPVAVQNQIRSDSRYTKDQVVIEQTYRRQLRMIRRAQQLGVIMGVGTDAGAAGVQHGAGFWQELRLFREAGLTTEEILTAATRNAAYITGLEDTMGIIAPGRPAYLLVVDNDLSFESGQLSGIRYMIRPRPDAGAVSSSHSA
ncbi:MAG: amidohydrolase family protein [Thermacetogeniaceae bacterium]